MEHTKASGVYIMREASMLSGMHPQTLRKYERANCRRRRRSLPGWIRQDGHRG
jgi:hypothetical protein